MYLNQNDPLDRLWAATRPEEPGPEVFDKIWSSVSAQAAEPEPPAILAFVNWKQWGLSVAIAAQAAALLIAGVIALRRPAPSAGFPVNTGIEVAASTVRIASGSTAIASLGIQPGQPATIEIRPQVAQSETDMVAVESDILGFMEAYRKVQEHDLRVKEGSTLFASIDFIGELARVETRPQVAESETDMVAVESVVLAYMESLP